jgi:hypothetical protein
MIDNVIWRVEQIDVNHESAYGHPDVTATLKMFHDPLKPYPEWYFSEQLKDDLSERLAGAKQSKLEDIIDARILRTMRNSHYGKFGDGQYVKIPLSTLYGSFKKYDEMEAYCVEDVRLTNAFVERMVSGNHNSIGKVIFNDPATIIIWRDGSKTVVKCQNGEPFDAEKGFVMAYLKKLLGNDNTFNKEIAKWVKYDAPKEDADKYELGWIGKQPKEFTFTIKADQISFDDLLP